MTYHNVARHLAAEGRGADSTLVHMSPSEVRGLQALAMAHGGSLTINPDTGLPEAGFLSNILPIIGGAALTAMGVPPPFAAAIMGGGTALATGDINKGVMAGIGAFGGAGLGSGLMSAGTQAAAQQAATQAIPELAMGAGTAAQQAAAMGGAAGTAGTAASMSPFATMSQGISALGSEAGRSAFMQGVGGMGKLAGYGLAAAAPTMLDTSDTKLPSAAPASKPLNRLEYQARRVSPTPSPDVPGYEDPNRDFGGQERYYDGRYVDTGRPFVPGDFGPTTPMPQPSPEPIRAMAKGGSVPGYFFGGIAALRRGMRNYPQPDADMSANQMAQFAPQNYAAPSYQDMGYGGDFGYQAAPIRRMLPVTPKDSSQSAPTAGMRKFAYESMPVQSFRGIDVPGYYNDMGQDFGTQRPYFSRRFRDITPPPPKPAPEPAPSYYDPGYSTWAAGGETHLGDYSDGGRMLRGPGDGVSDSIPATIGGKQPARLADGEFVVPARIVSELGNGSSEAGARKLYAMMDRIQSARGKTVGKKRVAVDSKAEKLLPA